MMLVVGCLAQRYQPPAAVMESQQVKGGPMPMTAGGNCIQLQVGGTVDTSVARDILDHQEHRINLQRKVVMEGLHHLVTLEVALQLLEVTNLSNSI